MITVYLDDGVTPAGTLAPDREAGQETTPIELHIKNDGDQEVKNVLIFDVTESQTVANHFRRSGITPQDERWGLFRVIGYDNTADPTWRPASTDWTRLGAYGYLGVDRIPAGCKLVTEYKERLPATALVGSWNRQLTGTKDEYSQPAPEVLTRAMRGILHGVGDRGRSFLIRGSALTETGTPDANVNVSAALYLWKGDIKGVAKSAHALNQNDSAAAALAVGQLYYAAVSYGATGAEITKGLKGTAPAKPTPPAGNILRGYVRVLYRVGGTSEIETADIEESFAAFGRFALKAGTGLQVLMSPGESLGGGSHRVLMHVMPIAVPASVTRYVWQLESGLPELTATTAPPSDSAIGPWYQVTSDGSGITSIVDLRTYAGETVVLRLGGAYPSDPATIATLLAGHEELQIEDVQLYVPNSGASGETKSDVFINGTTIFTSFASDDQRPRVAYDAATPIDSGRVHEVTVIRRNDLVRHDTTSEPGGGNPAIVELNLICRRP